jgi:hypothetical protein
VEAGEGSGGREGRGGRTPADEEQARIGRDRAAKGLPPDADADEAGGLIGGDAGDRGLPPGSPPVMPPAIPPGTAEDPVDIAPRFRPWSEPAPSTTGPLRCNFLRSVGPDGRLADSQATAVPTHRCAAFGDPLPLSLRQQELVCLQRVHVSCPRYVRGMVLANENAAPAVVHGGRPGISLKMAAAIVLVITAVAVLITGPVLGVLPLGGVGRGTSPVLVSPSPAVTATPPPSAAPSPSPTASPTATPSPSPTPTPTPTATPTPTPTPTVASSWPPAWDAERRSLLVPCTDQPNCWWYTVRGPGPEPSGNGSGATDEIPNIATYFKVDVDEIYALNDWTSPHAIQPGDRMRIPPPAG